MQVPGMFGEGGAALWGETGRDHWNPTAGWGRLAVCLSTRSLHLSEMMLASSMGIAHTSHSSLNQLPFKKVYNFLRFPGGSDGKESACSAGDLGLIPGSGRSPEERNGNQLHYSCLGNPRIEEPGRLQSMGSQRLDTANTQIHTPSHCNLRHSQP